MRVPDIRIATERWRGNTKIDVDLNVAIDRESADDHCVQRPAAWRTGQRRQRLTDADHYWIIRRVEDRQCFSFDHCILSVAARDTANHRERFWKLKPPVRSAGTDYRIVVFILIDCDARLSADSLSQ